MIIAIEPTIFGVLGLLIGWVIGEIPFEVIRLYWLPILSLLTPVQVPALALYFNYLMADSHPPFNESQDKLTVDGDSLFVKRITLVERNIRNDKFFPFAPWIYFYYFKVETERGTYYRTCLTIEKSKVRLHDHQKSRFPWITKATEAKKLDNQKENRFIEKYRSKSNDDLSNIVRNSNKYQSEAVAAAIEILKERNMRLGGKE